MAKLINPLMSFSANGSIKKMITFSSVRNVAVAKSYLKYSAKRKLAPSVRQIQIQENFKNAQHFYRTATNSEIESKYNSATKNISGKNNLVMLPIMKNRPLLFGLSFLGDNTLGLD